MDPTFEKHVWAPSLLEDEAVEDFRQLLVRLIGLLFATCMSALEAKIQS